MWSRYRAGTKYTRSHYLEKGFLPLFELGLLWLLRVWLDRKSHEARKLEEPEIGVPPLPTCCIPGVNLCTSLTLCLFVSETEKIMLLLNENQSFPGGSVVKNLPANAGDMGLSPGLGRSPGRSPGNPLESSCLENTMDRGAWWATVHGGRKESDTT